MKRIVKLARKTPKKLPAMPRTAETASGTETETCWCAVLDVLGRARVAEPGGKLVGVAEASRTGPRQVVEEVAHRSDEWHEQYQHQEEDRDRGAEHRDRGRKPSRHPRLRHHEAHGVLEDERQEDADEDDEERVADRPERDCDSDDGQDGEQRPRREQELGAPHSSSFHCAEGYGGVRLDGPESTSATAPVFGDDILWRHFAPCEGGRRASATYRTVRMGTLGEGLTARFQ